MMNTRRNKISKNKTRRKCHKTPVMHILKKGASIYASKKYSGDEILKYTAEQEKKYHDNCLIDNISWFGDLKQAKSYNSKGQHVYKWIVKNPTYLLEMNRKNEKMFSCYFNNTTHHLQTVIQLTPSQLKKAKTLLKETTIKCSYLDMSVNKQALFEFQFAYGYITIEQQYQFMKLVAFLIEHKFLDIKMREGVSIINKLNQKIEYYYLFNKTYTKQKYNRLSIYLFDKFALRNVCKIMPSHYNISGVIQENTNSFWFPDLILYKMDIKEYVLYNPHHNLAYDKMIE